MESGPKTINRPDDVQDVAFHTTLRRARMSSRITTAVDSPTPMSSRSGHGGSGCVLSRGKYRVCGPRWQITMITVATQLAAPAVAVSSRRRPSTSTYSPSSQSTSGSRAILQHPFEMKLDGLADFRLHLFQRIPDRHTAGQIG